MSRPETKAEKFERVLKPRLDMIAHAFRLMPNLMGNSYESTAQRRGEVIDNLRGDLKTLECLWAVQGRRGPQYHADIAQQSGQFRVTRIAPPVGICRTCWGREVAPSGVDGGSWVPCPKCAPEKPPLSGANPDVVIMDEVPRQPDKSRDREDIRAALEIMVRLHGPNDPGVLALRAVVLGWVPPESGS